MTSVTASSSDDFSVVCLHPVLQIFIAPSYYEGEHHRVSVRKSDMTRVYIFSYSFDDLCSSLGRFFGVHLPVVIVGRTCRVHDDDSFVAHLKNTRFVHRQLSTCHLLVRHYRDDLDGQEAMQRLNSVAHELSTTHP